MWSPSRQVAVLCATLLIGGVGSLIVALSTRGPVEMTFWFEPISDEARQSVPDRIAGGVTVDDMKVIETIARDEVVRAFREFPVAISSTRIATYRVRVVDQLRNDASGESHLIVGLGGQGFVNFQLLAHGAVSYAPAHATRDAIIAGIGRGIGRAAVHELSHQLLGADARIDASSDVQSYEYGSANRPEQYYGPMHWDIAAPMLRKRFGLDRR